MVAGFFLCNDFSFVLFHSTFMMCVVFLSFAYVCLQASEAFRRGEFNVFLFFFTLHNHAPLYIHEGIFTPRVLFGQLDGGTGNNKRYLISPS